MDTQGVRIKLLGGPMVGLEFELRKDPVTIGRGDENDICLPLDITISRSHAQLCREKNDFWLEDLGSRNGTFIGDSKVNGRERLASGSVFKLGSTEIELLDALHDKKGSAAKLFKKENLDKKEYAVMFTDLKDSVAFFEEMGTELAVEWIQNHNDIIIPIIRKTKGMIVKEMGDSIMAIFEKPENAVKASVVMQRAIARHNEGVEVKNHYNMRISLNAGKVTLKGGDAFGTTVNLAARIDKVTSPGQILIGERLNTLTDEVKGVSKKFHSMVYIKGLKDKVSIYEVFWKN